MRLIRSRGSTYVVLLAVLPLAITAINPNWLYNPNVLNDVDTWIYNGLFRYFFDFASSHPSDMHYFVERLSWVLPGYALYHVFPPVLANAILHLTVYYLGVFAVYGTARRLFGGTAAFVVALCMGTYTWWLRAAGHDYLDGVGIAYFSAAIWYATVAAYRERRRWYLFSAGAFLALTLTTQLFWAAFFPVIALYYLLLVWDRPRVRIVLDGLVVALGGIAVIAGMMLFNLLTVGKWNIFANSIDFVKRTAGAAEDIKSGILASYGLIPSTWMVLPCVAAICIAVCFARWRRVPTGIRRPLRAVAIMFAAMMAIFTYFHFTSPFVYFHLYLYMSFVIPATFLTLGGIVAVAETPHLSPLHLLLAFVLVLIPFALVVLSESAAALLLDQRAVWLIAFVAIAILAAGLLAARPFIAVGSFAVLSFVFGGNTGVAFHDRLRTYNRFVITQAVVDQIASLYPTVMKFYDAIVWTERRKDEIESAIYGLSQPIYHRSTGWESYANSPLEFADALDILVLSGTDDPIDRLRQLVDDEVEVQVNHIFPILSIDEDGDYRGYAITLKRHHAYDTALIPYGASVGVPARMPDNSVAYVWTGPDDNVVMKFNLPAPEGDITMEMCGILAILPLAEQIPATVNSVPVTFVRQPAIPTCNPLYFAQIPQSAIVPDRVTEIALSIPTAPADILFHNGDMRELGMAIRSVSFNTQDAP